jgi:hypothetical protein
MRSHVHPQARPKTKTHSDPMPFCTRRHPGINRQRRVHDEIDAAPEALAIGGPRPRMRKRRSSTTPKLVPA